MVTSKEISERLIKLRGEKPQSEVAKATKIKQKTLSNYENGIRIPRDCNKKRLADYFGVTVDSIFFDDNTTVSGVKTKQEENE